MRKGVPRGRNGETATAIAIPVTVDVETVRIKVTDIDMIAIRVQIDAYFCPCHRKQNNLLSIPCILFGSRLFIISSRNKQEVLISSYLKDETLLLYIMVKKMKSPPQNTKGLISKRTTMNHHDDLGLPRGRNGETAMAKAIPVTVDAETARRKATDTDTIAIRAQRGCSNVDSLK